MKYSFTEIELYFSEIIIHKYVASEHTFKKGNTSPKRGRIRTKKNIPVNISTLWYIAYFILSIPDIRAGGAVELCQQYH